jgi:hypothetical protein
MKPIWTTPAGTLGTLQEKSTTLITLNAQGTNLKYILLNGELPAGMRLENNRIVGTPFEVADTTVYDFVVRVYNDDGATDRAFSITIEGADDPLWLTPEGTLDVGPNGENWVLNRSPLDYQLSATDTDLVVGDTLEFYLDDLAGELPPGLTLTRDGKLQGIIDAPLTLNYEATNANYDRQDFDVFPYDYGAGTQPGDEIPRYISRNYEFRVTVSDGITRAQRRFRIFVVNEQVFRADTTTINVDTTDYIASATYLRAPIWTTTGNLGIRRANNYVTIPLEVYDPNKFSGTVEYEIIPLEDSSASVLPPGMSLDSTNGVLFGKVPYQPAVTQSFTFRIRVTRTDPTNNEQTFNERTFILKIQGEVDSTIQFTSPTILGTLSPNQLSTIEVKAVTSLKNADVRYRKIAGNLPPGLILKGDGSVVGKVNQLESSQGAADGLLTIDLLNYGLNSFILDGGTTTIDRQYRFTVQARDYYQASAVEKEFRIAITADSLTQFSNIYLKPLLPKEKREYFYSFITDDKTFPEDLLYRPSDPNFGVQNQIQMLLQHGIETVKIEKYVPALITNFNRKVFLFGDIKIATADDSNGDTLYEIIYVEIIDPLENKNGSVSQRIEVANGRPIDASQNLYKVSTNLITIDQLVNKFLYPSSVTNMKDKLKEIVGADGSSLLEINENLLPEWMKSVQSTGTALGFTKAVPIAYIKPGYGISILDNIKKTGFDFKNIEFDIDRLIIDSVEGQVGDKYIAFPKRKVI